MLRCTFIDEVGFDRLEQEDARHASLFFKVIDGRYCKGSTLITTRKTTERKAERCCFCGDKHDDPP